MKLQIDTTEGKVIAQLYAATRDNRYCVPLVRAICRNTWLRSIEHAGSVRYHYFKFDNAANTPTVEFSFNNRNDVNNSELVAELVRKSQDVLSRECERLNAFNEDLETLIATDLSALHRRSIELKDTQDQVRELEKALRSAESVIARRELDIANLLAKKGKKQ